MPVLSPGSSTISQTAILSFSKIFLVAISDIHVSLSKLPQRHLGAALLWPYWGFAAAAVLSNSFRPVVVNVIALAFAVWPPFLAGLPSTVRTSPVLRESRVQPALLRTFTPFNSNPQLVTVPSAPLTSMKNQT